MIEHTRLSDNDRRSLSHALEQYEQASAAVTSFLEAGVLDDDQHHQLELQKARALGHIMHATRSIMLSDETTRRFAQRTDQLDCEPASSPSWGSQAAEPDHPHSPTGSAAPSSAADVAAAVHPRCVSSLTAPGPVPGAFQRTDVVAEVL